MQVLLFNSLLQVAHQAEHRVQVPWNIENAAKERTPQRPTVQACTHYTQRAHHRPAPPPLHRQQRMNAAWHGTDARWTAAAGYGVSTEASSRSKKASPAVISSSCCCTAMLAAGGGLAGPASIFIMAIGPAAWCEWHRARPRAQAPVLSLEVSA